ncbi:MAG: hypothetical protein K2Q10_10480 [Rhodospirillales bacterium]|nr:hypothetical protein [Rhodospirillales bacterium]
MANICRHCGNAINPVIAPDKIHKHGGSLSGDVNGIGYFCVDEKRWVNGFGGEGCRSWTNPERFDANYD